MHKTQKLIDCFQKNKYTCLIANNGEIVYTSFDKGVRPLTEFYHSQNRIGLNDLQLIDKVIGKGAAFLCVLIGIKRIHTDVISKSALDVLDQYKIQTTYETMTEYIVNADKTGYCPVETLSEKFDTPESFYPALLDFFKKRGVKKSC